MLLQELDHAVKDMKGSKNPIADHLSEVVIDDTHETPFLNLFF